MATLPRKISGFRSGTINSLIQYLQDGVIVESSDHRIEKTPSGLMLHNVEKPKDILDFPFRCSHNGKVIRVTQGTWTRNASSCALEPDTDKTFYTITGLGNPAAAAWQASLTDAVVYLQLSSSTYDPRLAPDAVNVYAATALPADTPVSGNVIIKLATFNTDADGVVNSLVQNWTGGDIDDVAYVPDTDTSYDTAGDNAYYSIELSARVDRHYLTLQDYNWDAAVDEAPDANSLFVYRHVSDPGGANEAYVKKYCSMETLADTLASGGFLQTDTATTTGQVSEQFSIEWRDMGEGLGEALQIHDMDADHLTSITQGWDFCMRTAGVSVAGQNKVVWADSDALKSYLQSWVETTISVTEPAYHNLDSVVHGDYSGAGKVQGYIATCTSVNNWDWVSSSSILTTAGGLDKTNWFTDGLFTGASVVEIDAEDLQPTDKILVYRA